MKFSNIFLAFLISITVLAVACSSDDDLNQECYRCTYPQNPPTTCDSILVVEVCVLRPHESSLQMVLELTEKCNGQINNVSEDIDFLDNVLAEQQNAGATCEEF